MALIILFIVAGIFLYKGTCIVDRKLQKNYDNGVVIDEPETEEEKEAAQTTAIKQYGADTKIPILFYRQSEESENKRDRILIIYFLYVVAIVVATCGLMFVLY